MTDSTDLESADTTTSRVKHPLIVTMPVTHPHQSPIRSFALRGGHMSEAQKRAYDEGMAIWSLPFSTALADYQKVFGNSNPVLFEIGFGMGETTAIIAAAHPELNFLAAEVYTSGVGSLMKRIIESKLTNIRVIQHDAVEVLTHMLPLDSLHGVHIYFPDPWHKARHNKRRLIQPPFVKLLAQRMQVGGYLHCATDWQDYAVQMLDVLSKEPQLKNTVDTYAPTPPWRPQTKFETRGLKLGHGVWDLLLNRTTLAYPHLLTNSNKTKETTMPTKLDKVMYTAKAHTTGGRDGRSVSDDGLLDVKLSPPKAMGGTGDATNPEQLFAAGYSACFMGALKHVAGLKKITVPADASIDASIDIGPIPAGFGIAAKLVVHLPGLDRVVAQDLVDAAHQVCPYSNATRGNIEVDLTLA